MISFHLSASIERQRLAFIGGLQEDSLCSEFPLKFGYGYVGRLEFAIGSNRGSHTGGLPGQPALRYLTHEGIHAGPVNEENEGI